MTSSITAIIVAAGTGARLGAGLPKAFVLLGGEPLFLHSLRTFATHQEISETILVVSAPMLEQASEIIAGARIGRKINIIKGGSERWQSVKNGVDRTLCEWVLVHDAARPFVTHSVINDVLSMREKYDSVITATPETDTVRTFENDLAGAVIDRSKLIRVGTPQLFRREKLLKAFELAGNMDRSPTDEAQIMQQAGVPTGFSRGDPANFKITTASDLAIAEAIV
nr:2-C-methyl-D-erythritol 4-phosphate cytidylyltransferase [Chitinispirillaceae bacterium]